MRRPHGNPPTGGRPPTRFQKTGPMTSDSPRCDLCGLPAAFGDFPLTAAGRAFRFCCPGCRQVFSMLLEISGSPDPDAFRKTDIYRRCREAGIIPADSADLEAAVRRQHPDGGPSDGDVPDSSKNSGDPNQLDAAFAVSGMWCPACAWVIEETLLGTEGVFHARCLFATDRLQVAYDPRRVSPVRIADRISRLGYGLTEPGEDRFREERRRDFIRFGVSAFLTMNVMMLSFSLYSGFFFSLPEDAVWKLSWPIAVMATAVLLYGGARVHRRGGRGCTGGGGGGS